MGWRGSFSPDSCVRKKRFPRGHSLAGTSRVCPLHGGEAQSPRWLGHCPQPTSNLSELLYYQYRYSLTTELLEVGKMVTSALQVIPIIPISTKMFTCCYLHVHLEH